MNELNSQKVRKLAPENDPLKIGMGWTIEDLNKPQILVELPFAHTLTTLVSGWLNLLQVWMKALRYAPGPSWRP
ncbi:MAG: hypothetical protein Q4D12_10085 [Bacteroidales bacterium]|nr:hypothetical protein [Bacteroidales bacterium]